MGLYLDFEINAKTFFLARTSFTARSLALQNFLCSLPLKVLSSDIAYKSEFKFFVSQVIFDLYLFIFNYCKP